MDHFTLICVQDILIGNVQAQGILVRINEDVDEINSLMLSMLPRDVKSYITCDTLSCYDGNDPFIHLEPTELLNSLEISTLSDHFLCLKLVHL